jgi:hypothetical protein
VKVVRGGEEADVEGRRVVTLRTTDEVGVTRALFS